MNLPLNLLTATVGANHTNVLTTTTLVATPGAARRLRIWFISLRGSTASVGAATIEVDYRDSAGTVWVGTASWANPLPHPELVIPGGRWLATDTTFVAAHVASAAGPFAYRWVVGYTVEDGPFV